MTGKWEGGNPACDHLGGLWRTAANINANCGTGVDRKNAARRGTMGSVCSKCGAVRTDAQLGSEPSPDCGTRGQAQCGGCFVCNMVAVFREVRRVLRGDGTCWLNLGDSYGGNSDIPHGNLVGVPWRVALALQADGWVLRQDVIWHKPAPMPESVRNRCTKAHEYVFLLAKGAGYYCDMEAVKVRGVGDPNDSGRRVDTGKRFKAAHVGFGDGMRTRPAGRTCGVAGGMSNKRSVWSADDHRALLDWLGERYPEALSEFLGEGMCPDVWRVSSKGYPGAHFATYPPRLVEPCILAGTSERGACAACGAPHRRIIEDTKLTRYRPNSLTKRTGEEGTGNFCPNDTAGVETRTVGWKPTCGCRAGTRPCIVLDPFIGSGTTAEVCVLNGRWCWGIDLSESYLRNNAVPRIEGVLRQKVATVGLLPARTVEAPDARAVGLGGRSARRK